MLASTSIVAARLRGCHAEPGAEADATLAPCRILTSRRLQRKAANGSSADLRRVIGAFCEPDVTGAARWTPELCLFAGKERPAEADLELDVRVQPHAVDRLTHGLRHRRRNLEVVDLVDQVPRPRLLGGADLEDVVAEGGDDAGT